MTVTASIGSQSIGTGSNVGNDKFAQKVTCASGTTAFLIEAKVTNGASAYDPSLRPMIWYASSSFSVTAAAAVDLLRNAARYLEVIPSPNGSVARIRATELETIRGGYIYIWCDIPTVTVAQTLDVDVVELP